MEGAWEVVVRAKPVALEAVLEPALEHAAVIEAVINGGSHAYRQS